MLSWKVTEAAAKAGVSPNTITRVESDGSVNTATLKAMQAAYEAGGVRFTTDGGICPTAVSSDAE
jgi:transcriptional regulator with XRE-family HTH domain